jgi:DNA-binding NtrC family response regulator
MDRILIVDPGSVLIQRAEAALRDSAFIIDLAVSPADAMRLARIREYGLAMVTVGPYPGSHEIPRWFAEHSPATALLAVLEDAQWGAQAIQAGAADIMLLQPASPAEIRLRVLRIFEMRACARERMALREEVASRFLPVGMAEQDPKTAALWDIAARVARSSAAVLLIGPSGSGKEFMARFIHGASARAGRPFVRFSCSASPPDVTERDLFGYETDRAITQTGPVPGRIEQACGGSLFLDEVGALDASLQARLLRVIEAGAFERVGGSRDIDADVRLIAASCLDLRTLVAEGRFREDLYYRLNTVPLTLYPLKDRPADIPVLARRFLERASAKLGKPEPVLSPRALEALLNYDWPGNAAELENSMERAALLSSGKVEAHDLPIPQPEVTSSDGWRVIEREAIEKALHACHGNRTHAARLLGISLRKLQYRLKEYRRTQVS